MADIYNRVEPGVAGAITAEGSVMTVSSGRTGFITQALGLNYAQPVNRIYEIGSPNVYLISGRTRGDGGIQSVVGPSATVQTFYSTYGNVCNASANTLRFTFNVGCSAGGNNVGSMSAKGVVLTNVSRNTQSESIVISEAVAFMFAALTLE